MKKKLSKYVKHAAIAGVVLGLVCHYLPDKVQAVCGAISKVTVIGCGGGI